ncbi:dihydrodipicolinate synthase family protein [Spelaeicoccus albus]|uniref:4-hydroxy-tetrahydrodipicolinate synthase n=1 Tax=Spelaeicoccus albus TaxID=1280376 RepID=A0A7Z0D2T9_9MICO|nr:dihydrodipicolinate synthase family protein [Spelaeicoccus albus]NYI67854.1 4-hydroxy-tetrahydrodipicolinate synthase [Spelaeicoccus albus]
MTTIDRLTGVVPPLVTPLNDDYSVDENSLTRLVDHLLSAGVDGLFVLGSTGEAALLPPAERGRAVAAAVAAADGRVPVLVGAIDTATLRVIEHVRQAEELGADGVVVTAPFYTRTHPAEIDRHFRDVKAATSLPVFAYDIPVSTGTKLSAGLLTNLGRDGVIAGVKDSSGDDAGIRALVLAAHDANLAGFSVLTGSELTVDSAFGFGVDGNVPGLGNVDPAGYVRLYRATAEGRWEDARAEQERLIRLFGLTDAADVDRMGRASSALGAFKAALHLLGVIDNPVTAPPYLPLSASDTEFVKGKLVEAGLL